MVINHFPMRTTRALVAGDPLKFGRAAEWQLAADGEKRWTIPDDLRLFASTFAAGFLFVAILIA